MDETHEHYNAESTGADNNEYLTYSESSTYETQPSYYAEPVTDPYVSLPAYDTPPHYIHEESTYIHEAFLHELLYSHENLQIYLHEITITLHMILNAMFIAFVIIATVSLLRFLYHHAIQAWL